MNCVAIYLLRIPIVVNNLLFNVECAQCCVFWSISPG